MMPRLAGHRRSVETENRQRKTLLMLLCQSKSLLNGVHSTLEARLWHCLICCRPVICQNQKLDR
jgi:hypothetical protein